MAKITLGDLKQLWQNVSDWVKGVDSVSAPKVTVDSSALPTGAATASKQDEQTSHLSTIAGVDFATDTKLDSILSKLGDIEAELESIRTTDGIKQISDTVPVELTGSNVEVIKEFLNTEFGIGNTNYAYYGDTAGLGSSRNPLDVRKYKTKNIKIRNGYDQQVAVQIISYRLLTAGTSSGAERLEILIDDTIAAGASKVYKPKTYPELADAHIGLAVRINASVAATTGNVDVIFIGGAN